MLTPKKKSPLREKFSLEKDETAVLHQAGQRAKYTISELFRPISVLVFTAWVSFSRKKI